MMIVEVILNLVQAMKKVIKVQIKKSLKLQGKIMRLTSGNLMKLENKNNLWAVFKGKEWIDDRWVMILSRSQGLCLVLQSKRLMKDLSK